MDTMTQLVLLQLDAAPQPYGPFITRAQALSQGIAQYYLGKQCKRGHFAARTIVSRNCIACFLEVHNKKPRIRTEEQLERARRKGREYMRAKRAAMTPEERRQFTASRSDYILSYVSSRRRIDHGFRLRMNLRHRTWTALKGQSKSARTADLVGCTMEELRCHLERQFLPGMTWENYGKHGWHIDHIRPCASFDLTDPEQQRQCFHYTNLQPLWAADNIRKGAKVA